VLVLVVIVVFHFDLPVAWIVSVGPVVLIVILVDFLVLIVLLVGSVLVRHLDF